MSILTDNEQKVVEHLKEVLEAEATKAQMDDQWEVSIGVSIAISLKRIADLLERIEPVIRRPPRT